jgi:hypothetical protein
LGSFTIEARSEFCKNRFADSQKECDAAETWAPENFTDPEQLDQVKSFKIIFHSITAFGWASTKPGSGSWNEKLLNDPTLIANNPQISTCLLSNEKRATFMGRIGFILRPVVNNIVGSKSSDAGTRSYTGFTEEVLSSLENNSKGIPIRTPDKILQDTTAFEYNEIVWTGTNQETQEKMIPTGVLIKCRTKEMLRLNHLNDKEFRKYITTQCRDFDKEVIDALNKLRVTYPMFGYELVDGLTK